MTEQKTFRILFKPVLRLLALLVIKTWWLVLVLAVIWTVVSVEFARKLELDTNVMSILPSQEPVVSDFLETSRLFGFSDKLITVIKLDEGVSDTLVVEFMDNFAGLLRQSTLIEAVEYKLPNLSFNDEAKRIEEKFDIYYTFYNTPEKDFFLMFISPFEPPGDIEFSKKIMKEIEEKEYQARKTVKGNITGLKVEYAGGYVIALEEAKNMEKNVKVTVLTSLACIGLFFFVAFKRLGIVFCVGIPLVMSILWTLSVAYFAVGSLNIMTAAFAAILAGLGIDFGIHISNRFLFELSSGKNPDQAIQTSIFTTGEGVFFSCATTALAFYSLLWTGFRGAAEFGFLIGTGLVLCMIAMLLVLPSLLVLVTVIDKRRQTSVFDYPGFQLLAVFIEKYGRGISVFLILIFSACSFYMFSRHNLPEFDNRLDNMSSKKNQAIQVQKEILERFGNCFEPIAIVAGDKDPDQAMKLLQNTMPMIQRLLDRGILIRFESIFKYLPSLENRNWALEKMGKIKDPEKALDYLLKRLEKVETKKEEYDFFLQERDEILHILRSNLSLELFTYGELKRLLPEVLFNKFFAVRQETSNYYTIAYLYPAKRIIKEEQIRELADCLNIDGEKLKMTGLSLVVGRLEHLIQREFRFITLYISAALILVLLIIYRRIPLVVISVIPLFMGLTATVLVMLALGIKLNYMNIVAFPLIIGMGIDDSIHLLYRYFENNEKSIKIMIRQTGKGVLLTSLTTMVGFGSLVFTGHNGLISLGIITSAGMGFCLLTSLFVLPGLIQFIEPKNEKKSVR